jgi:hypothetical protein
MRDLKLSVEIKFLRSVRGWSHFSIRLNSHTSDTFRQNVRGRVLEIHYELLYPKRTSLDLLNFRMKLKLAHKSKLEQTKSIILNCGDRF